jgi:DNA-binding transcriptional LysR family regulator
MDRLAALEIFVRVVDTGSFSAAARQMRIGQPAVSKAIARLEERIDGQLLRRSTHGLAPTEAGKRFYSHAKRAIEEADLADHVARDVDGTLSGRLRICAAVTFARLHILPHLGKFMSSHPQLDIDVMLDDRIVDLIESGADICLRMGDLADSTLTARKIGQAARLVVGTPSYLESNGQPDTPEDVLKHHVIIHDIGKGGGDSWTFCKGEARASITVRSKLRVSAAEGVRECVFSDLGLTIASKWMFGPELASGRVRAVLTDWALPPLNLWAIFPDGRQSNAKVRAFLNFIVNHLP